MDNAIKIGSEISEENCEYLKELIETTFRVGAETRMDQSTIVEALNLIVKVFKVENVSISNSTFRGDNNVHMPEDD